MTKYLKFLVFLLLAFPIITYATVNPQNAPSELIALNDAKSRLQTYQNALNVDQVALNNAQAAYSLVNTSNINAYNTFVQSVKAYNASPNGTNLNAAYAAQTNWKNINAKLAPLTNTLAAASKLVANDKTNINTTQTLIDQLQVQYELDSGYRIEVPSVSLGGKAIIDVLILHTPSTNSKDLQKFIDDANLAFTNSFITTVEYRLVGTLQINNYPDTNPNVQALNDMATGVGPFNNLKQQRLDFGADIVVLIRPSYTTQLSCGTSDQGFTNGGPGNRMIAFGTVSYGVSIDNHGMHCLRTAFAHELGHILGLMHDIPNSSGSQGAYPYSYGTGVKNVYGTIMSYQEPAIMFFSTPLLTTQCAGKPCGDPITSDQQRSVLGTAKTVADYQTTSLAKLPDSN